MHGYLLPLRCPACQGPIEHVTSSKVCGWTECSAVARCQSCGRQWQIGVTLRPAPVPESIRRRDRRVTA